jgi:copper chaperone CopZ
MTIEKAVTKLPGVRFLNGDPDAREVILEYDPQLTDVTAIEGAMQEEGYPVKK